MTQTQPAEPSVAPQKVYQRDLSERFHCSDCNDPVPNVVEDFAAGDYICGNCGLVLGARVIDTRSEWRTFSNSDDNTDDPSRVGAAGDPLLGGMNHIDSTIISQRDGGSGRARDLNRVHGKATNQKEEKTLMTAFKEIQTMCDRIGLSKITSDSAKQIYKKADDAAFLRGKSPMSVMAACIYIGCREQNATRTFKEICALTKVSKKEIGRNYKLLVGLLGKPGKEISMDSYIIRFSSALDLSQDVKRATSELLRRANDLGTLAGKSPISIVAACLYFVSCLCRENEGKSAKEIAQVAGCTESTLKNAYKLLYDMREQLGKDLKMPRDLSALTPP
ncbi:cyclin-like protein [Fimicolochytrium jonesii]|uniref:cyclin-like protein n=1 Tax=Fimicolochytrium jonesii TaxID=1396493 RepID=UPI0022FE46E8|nr:cyclin-like protein [Fimicolochytrium jonesii]KAI8823588.1 cyclin-like protein [Fimicolochytrium jonesii]